MNAQELENKLNALFKQITSKVANTLETEAVKSVKKNFEVGGRPVKWNPSVKSKKNAGTKTLVISGAMSEITSELGSTNSGIEITLRPGTNARAYSRIQHEGGTINRKPRLLRFKSHKSGRTVFAKNSHKRITKQTMSKPYSITIPPRPYLLIPPEDFPGIISRIKSAINL